MVPPNLPTKLKAAGKGGEQVEERGNSGITKLGTDLIGFPLTKSLLRILTSVRGSYAPYAVRTRADIGHTPPDPFHFSP